MTTIVNSAFISCSEHLVSKRSNDGHSYAILLPCRKSVAVYFELFLMHLHLPTKSSLCGTFIMIYAGACSAHIQETTCFRNALFQTGSSRTSISKSPKDHHEGSRN